MGIIHIFWLFYTKYAVNADWKSIDIPVTQVYNNVSSRQQTLSDRNNCYISEGIDMVLFILLAFGIAKLKGNRVTVLLREPSLIPMWILEIVFWLLQACIWMEDYRFIGYAGYLQMASILCLIWPILRFRLYPQAIAGAIMVSIGSISNRVVMAMNGGKMPVIPSFSGFTYYYREGALEVSQDVRHIMMSDSTKLNFLADYIDVGFSVISPGDVLIHLFTTIVVYNVIVSLNKKEKGSSL